AACRLEPAFHVLECAVQITARGPDSGAPGTAERLLAKPHARLGLGDQIVQRRQRLVPVALLVGSPGDASPEEIGHGCVATFAGHPEPVAPELPGACRLT